MTDQWKEVDDIVETLAYELDPDGEYNDGTFKRDIEAKVKADKAIRKLLEKVRQETRKECEAEFKEKGWLTQVCKGCGTSVSYCDHCNELWQR